MVRVMFPNPLLDKVAKFNGLLKQILSLCLGRSVRAVIINLVSLPSAGIKIRHQGRYGRPHGDLQHLEGRQMMSRADDTVAGARDHYLR
jgi:hypothetical protein